MNIHNDSLWIGRLIKDRVEDILPVYPCIAPDGTPLEFCTYRRAGYSARDSKDLFNYQETINLIISVVSPSYASGLAKAQKIKERLDGLHGVWEEKLIDSMEMTNATEDYVSTDYVQTLYFSVALDTTYGK